MKKWARVLLVAAIPGYCLFPFVAFNCVMYQNRLIRYELVRLLEEPGTKELETRRLRGSRRPPILKESQAKRKCSCPRSSVRHHHLIWFRNVIACSPSSVSAAARRWHSAVELTARWWLRRHISR